MSQKQEKILNQPIDQIPIKKKEIDIFNRTINQSNIPQLISSTKNIQTNITPENQINTESN